MLSSTYQSDIRLLVKELTELLIYRQLQDLWLTPQLPEGKTARCILARMRATTHLEGSQHYSTAICLSDRSAQMSPISGLPDLQT